MALLQQSLKAFVWSKMGTEAGQVLNDILRRKETERLANGGQFVWGIGQSLGDSIIRLMRDIDEPKAVFTPMKSKSKEIDSNPDEIMLWKSYILSGRRQPLPPYSFVTSRGKKKHYALLCYSEEKITGQNRGELSSRQLVNYKSGKPVGGSQVTTVVKVRDLPDERHPDYRIEFVASLYGVGQVELTAGVRISESDVKDVMSAVDDVEEWKERIERLRA